MPDQLTVTVVWPDKRQVRVVVSIEPVAGRLDEAVIRDERAPRWIDGGDLRSRDTLVGFFKSLTSTAASGEQRRALCLEVNEALLYEHLPYTPGQTEPVIVKVP